MVRSVFAVVPMPLTCESVAHVGGLLRCLVCSFELAMDSAIDDSREGQPLHAVPVAEVLARCFSAGELWNKVWPQHCGQNMLWISRHQMVDQEGYRGRPHVHQPSCYRGRAATEVYPAPVCAQMDEAEIARLELTLAAERCACCFHRQTSHRPAKTHKSIKPSGSVVVTAAMTHCVEALCPCTAYVEPSQHNLQTGACCDKPRWMHSGHANGILANRHEFLEVA